MFLGLRIIATGACYVGLRVCETLFPEPPADTRPHSGKNPNPAAKKLSTTVTPAPAENPLQAFIDESQRNKRLSLYAAAFLVVGRVIPPLRIVGIATLFFASIPYFKEIEQTARKEKKINVDLLFFFANIITIGLGQYITTAINMWLVYSGYELVGRVKNSTQKLLTDVFDQLPGTVWIMCDGIEVEVSISSLKAGDILVVKGGEIIPVDGYIQQGIAAIDQRALTGESQPAERSEGDYVFANTLVLSGRVFIKVDKSGQETVSAKIVKALQQSMDFKSKIQLKGEQWAEKATTPTFLLSLPIFLTLGPSSAAIFIYSHIGYRIRLLAPLATLEYVKDASHAGILVKDGRALESLYGVDTIVFDKTGTLTDDIPEVKRIVAFGQNTEKQILTWAAAAERRLSHPIALAITEKAEQEGITVDEVETSDYQLGFGIKVNVDGKTVRVGSLRFFKDEGIKITKNITELEEDAHNAGNSLVFVSVDDKISGAIELQAHIRDEAVSVIQGLRSLGIKHIAILSGDHLEPTRRLAEQLGVDDYFFGVLPEGKADIVKQLQSEGRSVCFIGDGINDAIAMKTANVSISLRGASSIAVDVAEVLLMDGHLTNVPKLVDIAQRLDAELKRRLRLTVIPSGINLISVFYPRFGIFGSLLLNTGFFFIAARDPMAVFNSNTDKQGDDTPS
jgi:heavy metal translocating P-type ATPase